MIQHILLLIYRNFQRFKTTFIINLIGLSAGLTCSLLIYLWVNDELSVDRFHEKDSQLYQVMENQNNGGEIITSGHTSGLVARSLKEDMPEVEMAAMVAPASWFDRFSLSEGDKNLQARGQFVEPEFFEIFSYPFLEGNASQVLSDPSNIVISRDLAMSLFNTTEGVIGKTLEWHLLHFSNPVKVAGIFENIPDNSSAQFDFALPYDVFLNMVPNQKEWGNHGPEAYLVLNESASPQAFSEKIKDYIQSKDPQITYRKLFVRPFSDGYLYGNYENGQQAGGRIEYVRLFSLIAAFILLIACINFMNLSTAKASRRIKEVGIKKAIGAKRNLLIAQYLGESLMMSFLSLLVAIVLVNLLLPHFNTITGKSISFALNGTIVLVLLTITLISGLLAGSYPALYLSGFNPATVLKGSGMGRANSATGESWARKGLVVFQFALSVILIVSVWIVYEQISFVQTKNLGYDRQNLITLPLEGKAAANAATFVSEIKKLPYIENAFSMENTIVGNGSTTVGLNWEGKDPDAIVRFQNFTGSMGMIETMGLTVIDGRSFSPEYSTDSSAIVFNEKAIEVMGLTDPVGKTVNLWGEDRQIIGVVKDFHFQSLHEEVTPLFIKPVSQISMSAVARVTPGATQEALAGLEEFYQTFNPGYTFSFEFVDDNYAALYAAEQKVSTLSSYFAGLAILISCLGLFGLAAFTAERRLKEIGIRKVLGSTNLNIIYLLSKDFTKMVMAAILIAVPISYLIASRWLQAFAYKITLEWWYFAGAGLIALVVAWFTVGLQTVKAAKVNPVKCLKDD